MAENKEEAKRRARYFLSSIAEKRLENRTSVSREEASPTYGTSSGISDTDFKEDVVMEAFLHILDPDLPIPRLVISPQQVEMRHIHPGRKSTAHVEIRNKTRGYIHGRATLSDASPGLFLESEEFSLHPLKSRNAVKLTVTADTSQALYGDAKLRITAFKGAFEAEPETKSYMDIPVAFSSTFPCPLLYPWVALLIGALIYILIVIFTASRSTIPLTPNRAFYSQLFNDIKYALDAHQYSFFKAIPLNNNMRTYACAPIYFLFCLWVYSTRHFRTILSKTWIGVNSTVRSLWGKASSNTNSGASYGSHLFDLEPLWVILGICLVLIMLILLLCFSALLFFAWFILTLLPIFISMFTCYFLGGAFLTTLSISIFLGYAGGTKLRKFSKFPEIPGVIRADRLVEIMLLTGIGIFFTLNLLIASGVI